MLDPYQILGVHRKATPDEIKAAFRKLGAKHHPDRNAGDPDAGRRFKEINAAYQILSDPKKRTVFDRFGAAGIGGAGNPFAGMPIDFSEFNVDGIFGDLLGALGIKFGDRGDLQIEVKLTFDEAVFGCTKDVIYKRIATCESCDGTGGEKGTDVRPCPGCDGRGKTNLQPGGVQLPIERVCGRCDGKGVIASVPCMTCSGVGQCSQDASLVIEVPPGVDTGTTKRISSQGSATRSDRVGTLEVEFLVDPHEFFRRRGDHVVCDLPITFSQATLGDEIEIPTMKGRGRLRIPPGTQPGSTLRVRGLGVPRRLGGRGDQLVEVTVEIPTDLTDRQRELVQELGSELGQSVQAQRRTFGERLKGFFD